MIAGSNCCAPHKFYLFSKNQDGSYATRNEFRLKLSDTRPRKYQRQPVYRGLVQPHLLDWDRDGNTDLLVVYPGSYVYSGPLWVSRGPLVDKHEFAMRRKDVLRKEDGIVDLSVEDLDRDGSFDLTVAWSRYDKQAKQQDYGVGWLRNKTNSGEPVFGETERLVSLPKPWRLIAFALVDWETDGHVDVAVSVSKGSRKAGYVRQLWLYKQKRGIQKKGIADPLDRSGSKIR